MSSSISSTDSSSAGTYSGHRRPICAHKRSSVPTNAATGRPTERADRQTDRQKDRPTDRQTDRQTDRHTDIRLSLPTTDRETNRQTDRQTKRKDRQTQADRAEGQTDRPTEHLPYSLAFAVFARVRAVNGPCDNASDYTIKNERQRAWHESGSNM